MRKVGIFLSAILFGIAGNSLAASDTTTVYRAFSPDGAGSSVLVKSGGKPIKYFIVEKGKSFGFNITGPAKIKIHTRAELDPGIKDLDYEIQVWEANNLIIGRRVSTTPSALALKDHSLGLGRDIYIKIPEGKHSYRLWITSETAKQYYVRFYQAWTGPGPTGFNIGKQIQFTREVTLVTGKKSFSYYLVEANGGVSLSIAGPSKLKIYCRANYSPSMKGKAKFTLGMYEGHKEAAEFPGTVKMAGAVQFKELSDLVPSTLNTYDFEVPPGNHIYEFKKIESASPNLAVRFQMVKAELGMLP